MKTAKSYLFTLALLAAAVTSSNAQQLLSGTFSGSNELLMGTKYRNVRNVNTNQSDAVYTGIPDLGSNRGAGTRNTKSLNYTNAGSYTFSITYSPASNSFTSTTVINGNSWSSTLSNINLKLIADGKTSNPSNINLIRLKVRTQNGASSIIVSNLVIDGLAINGNYGRTNNGGLSSWYATTNLLNNGFVISGTVTIMGNFANNADGQSVELDFGYTTEPGFGLLPLELNDFKVQQTSNGSNLLTWNTMHESNTSHFEIQRSLDGQNFTTVGKVTAAGESNVLRSYSYADHASNSATWYYRLLNADKDGKQTYSTVVKVKAATTENAATSLFVSTSQARLQFQTAGVRMVRIYNLQGAMQQQIKTNEAVVTVNISNLSSGNYVVHISDENGSAETLRFIK